MISSGRYQNTSEAPRQGIRPIERQELENEVRLKALREAAKTSIAATWPHSFSSASSRLKFFR